MANGPPLCWVRVHKMPVRWVLADRLHDSAERSIRQVGYWQQVNRPENINQ